MLSTKTVFLVFPTPPIADRLWPRFDTRPSEPRPRRPENRTEFDLKMGTEMSSPGFNAAKPGLGDIDPRFRHPRNLCKETHNVSYISLLRDLGHLGYSDDESNDDLDGDDSVGVDEASWSPVRHLSESLGDKGEISSDPHQDTQVVKFVEYGLKMKSLSCGGKDPTLVALIHDQTDALKAPPSRGGFTQSHLREHLGKPVRPLS